MNLLHEKRRAQSWHPRVAAAIVGSSLVGGAISASGAKSAANSQKGAADAATAAQRGMFDKTVELNDPFRTQGIGAMGKLSDLMGTSPGGGFKVDESDPVWQSIVADYQQQHRDKYGTDPTTDYNSTPDGQALYGHMTDLYKQTKANMGQPVQDTGGGGSLLKPFSMSDFQMDPGIQFQTKMGNQALMNSQAAKNGTLSGGALKDLIAYNQGMAGTGYQGAYDRFMANKSFTLGSLMDMTKVGQAAASGVTSAAPSFSSGVAGSMMGAGNAQAAGQVGMANAVSGGLSGASNGYFLSSLLNKTPDAGASGGLGVPGFSAMNTYG